MEQAIPPRQRPDVLTEFLPDGTALVFDPTTEMAHALTASGALVWECCDGTRRLDDLIAELAAAYDAPPDVLRRDVLALLEHLGDIGLLVTAADSAA